MPQQNQIIAIEKGVKAKAHRTLTDAYQSLKKKVLLDGISRNYEPLDAEGEQLPPESTRVQVRVPEVIAEVQQTLTELFDIVATKEWGNLGAKADIKVDGTTLAAEVPVTYLLFLEKQLTGIHTFIGSLPTLDPAHNWSWSDTARAMQTEPVRTSRSKKVPRAFVKAEATEHHPAQVDVWTEDIVVGNWTKTEFSGAIKATDVKDMLGRVEALQKAVAEAREEANGVQVERKDLGAAILGYLWPATS